MNMDLSSGDCSPPCRASTSALKNRVKWHETKSHIRKKTFLHQIDNRFMTISEHDILDFVAENPSAGRDAIRKDVARDASETTVWWALKRLVDEGRIEVYGRGRATGYQIAGSAVVRAHLSVPYNQRPPVECQAGFPDACIPGNRWYLCRRLIARAC